MPSVNVNGTHLHYLDEGEGPETIVFSHGLLLSGEMFFAQIRHFKPRYRCIAYDHRGQGKSEVTADGYDMETLTKDAEALIEHLGVGPCHFAGLSMGGFVGMRLALHRPDLLHSLILLGTSAEPEPKENKPRYRMLNFIARWFGLGLVVDKVMPILFGHHFMHDLMQVDERHKWRERILLNDRIGITRAVKGVINRRGVDKELHKIKTPTLILIGEEDTATVPAKSMRMHESIAGSTLVRIPHAGHSSTIEEPFAVNDAMEAFLKSLQTETLSK